MSPEKRVRLAWVLVVVCFIAWPITSLTVFADEPQGVLGLSWFALIFTAIDIVATTDVRDKAGEMDESDGSTRPGSR